MSRAAKQAICWISDARDQGKWQQRPFTVGVELGPRPQDNRDNHERSVGCEEPGPPQAIARRLADAILRFDIFPPHLATAFWRAPLVQIGDTIGLRYHFVPGLDLFFSARVIGLFELEANGQWHGGFTYRTVQGHPECGGNLRRRERPSYRQDYGCPALMVAGGHVAGNRRLSARAPLEACGGTRSSGTDCEFTRTDFGINGALVQPAP